MSPTADEDRSDAEKRRELARAWQAEHREELLQRRREWADKNRDRLREQKRQWREANLERHRELNRESMRRQAQRKRQAERRAEQDRQRAKAYYREHKDADHDKLLERSRKYRQEHPDRIKETSRSHYERNREKILARNTAHRDATIDAKRETNRRWREANPDRIAEYRRARRANPEAYQRSLEQNREAKQLKRRLEQAGLPPRQLQKVTAAERRRNDAAADEFFRRAHDERSRIQKAYLPTPPEDLQRWNHWRDLERERYRDHQTRARDVSHYLAHHEHHLREEIREDNVARQLQGKRPLREDLELQRRALAAVRPLLRERAVESRRAWEAIVEARMRSEPTLPGFSIPVDDEPELDTEPDAAIGAPSAPVGQVWVEPHTRRGVQIAGYWRSLPRSS